MSSLQKKFWQKRHTQLNDEVDTNLQSLYTWALQLSDVCKRRKQWRLDKKYITGNITTYVDGNEHLLAETIINFVVSGELNGITPKPVSKSKLKLTSKSESKSESKLTSNETIQVTVDADMPENDLASFTDNMLDEYKIQQDVLEKHMDERREKLYADESTGSNKRMNQLTDMATDMAMIGQDDQDEQRKQDLANPNLPDARARIAPTASAFLSLPPRKRDELCFNLFKQAKINVKSMMNTNDLSMEKTEILEHKEADRLLTSWIESNSCNKR